MSKEGIISRIKRLTNDMKDSNTELSLTSYYNYIDGYLCGLIEGGSLISYEEYEKLDNELKSVYEETMQKIIKETISIYKNSNVDINDNYFKYLQFNNLKQLKQQIISIENAKLNKLFDRNITIINSRE